MQLDQYFRKKRTGGVSSMLALRTEGITWPVPRVNLFETGHDSTQGFKGSHSSGGDMEVAYAIGLY